MAGVDNTQADQQSCKFHDRYNYQLHPELFQVILSIFGPLEIDLMVDWTNHQLPTYCSWQPDPQAPTPRQDSTINTEDDDRWDASPDNGDAQLADTALVPQIDQSDHRTTDRNLTKQEEPGISLPDPGHAQQVTAEKFDCVLEY